jgi:hypothetical protein
MVYASQTRLPEGVPGINVSNAVMMGHVRAIQWTRWLASSSTLNICQQQQHFPMLHL